MFDNKGQKGYQKLKTSLNTIEYKPMSEVAGQVIGFIFRETLNEILELALELKRQKRPTSGSKPVPVLTADELFETCRVFSQQNQQPTHKTAKYLFN